MRKILFIFVILLLGIGVAALFAWSNRAAIAAHYLAKHLRVPVTIQSLEVTRSEADIGQLWIGNPPRSKTSTAFTAGNIAIFSDLTQITSDPLIIDEIDISNIFVGIEYYHGGESNWSYILSRSAPKSQGRDYLIRTLILQNLTVVVTQHDGKVKRYPTIARMEFHNISPETGFPIEEIEKAIFNLMMQDLMNKLNFFLKQLPFNQGGSPLQYLPGLFGH